MSKWIRLQSEIAREMVGDVLLNVEEVYAVLGKWITKKGNEFPVVAYVTTTESFKQSFKNEENARKFLKYFFSMKGLSVEQADLLVNEFEFSVEKSN